MIKKDFQEELKKKINKAQSLEEKVEIMAKAFLEIYYNPYKDEWIQEIISELGLPILIRKKAISTHCSSWFGWKQSRHPKGKQYCVRGHSGYVNCFVIPMKLDKSNKHL